MPSSRSPRAAVYAWLEEIRFRTGITVLAGAVVILGAALAAVIVAASGGPAKTPPVAGQAPLAVPPLPARPSAPAPAPGRPGQPVRPARRVTIASPAAATGGSAAPRPAPGVPARAAAVRLTAAPDPAGAGQRVTYTVTISPAATSGTVTFADDGHTITGCSSLVITASGTARCQVSYPSTGTHTITAAYYPGTGPAGPAAVIGETIANCGQPYQGCNLQNANLQNATLAAADLQGANLQNAVLAGADLAGADLQGANLQNARLAGANLAGANLQGQPRGATSAASPGRTRPAQTAPTATTTAEPARTTCNPAGWATPSAAC